MGERNNAVAKIKVIAKKDRTQLVDALVAVLNGDDPTPQKGSSRELLDLQIELSRTKLKLWLKESELKNAKYDHDTAISALVSANQRQLDELKSEITKGLAELWDSHRKCSDLRSKLGDANSQIGQLESQLIFLKERWQKQHQSQPKLPQVKCAAPNCDTMFTPAKSNHITCSAKCRKALSRSKSTPTSNQQDTLQ